MIRFVITRLYVTTKLYRTRRGGWEFTLEGAYHYPTRRHAEKALSRMEKLDDVIYGSSWVERVEV